MPKEISDVGTDFLPTAVLTKEGVTLKGKLLSVRNVTTVYGEKPVYTLQVQEADCVFTQGKGHEVQPEEGAKVEFFAPTRLGRQLVQVPMGSIVSITNIGKKKVGRGNPAHLFKVVME